jgi:hypothetical protein
MTNSNKVRADQDSPWKLILRQYFREAIEFFFPSIAKAIDWTKPIEFLDKEFQQITPNAEIGRRYADQLVKVYRKSGKALILLVHLEVQASPEKGFAERMFTYAIRIFEHFHQFPVSLAILCDRRQSWRPTRYAAKTLGSTLQFDFTAVKLLDYQTKWHQLEASRNPFAIIVMTHLKTQETQQNLGDRQVWKFTLVKRLYELGYSRSEVLNLFKFIDWAMILPEDLKQAFWNDLKLYEEEQQMAYVTSVEQIGYDRGLQDGEATGAVKERRSLVSIQLEQKLGALPKSMNKRIDTMPPEQLQALAIALLQFNAIADLTNWLDAQK